MFKSDSIRVHLYTLDMTRTGEIPLKLEILWVPGTLRQFYYGSTERPSPRPPSLCKNCGGGLTCLGPVTK